MKLAVVISQTSPELVFNAFRLANFSRKDGDEVKVFLLAEGGAGRDQHPEIRCPGAGGSFPPGGRADLGMRDVPEAAQLARVGAVPLVHALIQEADRVVTF